MIAVGKMDNFICPLHFRIVRINMRFIFFVQCLIRLVKIQNDLNFKYWQEDEINSHDTVRLTTTKELENAFLG